MKETFNTSLGEMIVETEFRRDWVRWLLTLSFWQQGTHSGKVSGEAVTRARTERLQRNQRNGDEYDRRTWSSAEADNFPLQSQRGYASGIEDYFNEGVKTAEKFIDGCCNSHLNHTVFADVLYSQ